MNRKDRIIGAPHTAPDTVLFTYTVHTYQRMFCRNRLSQNSQTDLLRTFICNSWFALTARGEVKFLNCSSMSSTETPGGPQNKVLFPHSESNEKPSVGKTMLMKTARIFKVFAGLQPHRHKTLDMFSHWGMAVNDNSRCDKLTNDFYSAFKAKKKMMIILKKTTINDNVRPCDVFALIWYI